MAKRCIVITYEFPPSGGGGVQRIAKFCRYLPGHGWSPSVVAAEHVPNRSLDETLVPEVSRVAVIRTPHRHVATAISRVIAPVKRMVSGTRQVDDSSPSGTGAVIRASLSSRIARWFAVPDDAVFWKSGAVKAAVALGRREPARAVLASGPPYSAIVAGARAAKRLNAPLVVDMRDGWATSPVLYLPTPLHRAYSRWLERRALSHSALVVCATPAIAEEAKDMGAARAEVLTNGFDAEDLPDHRPGSGPLHVAFMGKMFYGHSDPTTFFTAMAQASERGGPASGILLTIVGSWPESAEQQVRQLGIADRVTFRSYLPHREALEVVAAADVGLVIVADRPGAAGTTPGKLYEYLGMGMPVMFVGPQTGFAVDLVAEANAGVSVGASDQEGIVEALVEWAERKDAGKPLPVPDAGVVGLYSRQAQAERLAGLLDEVVGDSESAT